MKKMRVARHYGRCGEKGHNSRTYIVKIKDVDDSNTSKE